MMVHLPFNIGLEIKCFFLGAQVHLQISYLKMLYMCIETSTPLGPLQKFEGAGGEFKQGHHYCKSTQITYKIYTDLDSLWLETGILAKSSMH